MKTESLTKSTYRALVLVLFSFGSAQAQTTFNGGSLGIAGNWSSGLPTPTSSGTVAVNGTMPNSSSHLSLNDPLDIAVSHTAGTIAISGGVRRITNTGGGSLIWNQTGGNFTVPSPRELRFGNVATDSTKVNLSSGSITGAGTTILRGNDSELNMSGGSLTTHFTVDLGATFNLSGGTYSVGNFIVSGGGDFTQTGANAWSANLFHVNGAGSTLNVATLADDTGVDPTIRFTFGASGTTSPINLTSANPFSLYDANASLGFDAWAAAWTVNLTAVAGIATDGWQSSPILTGFDMTGKTLNLLAYTAAGGPASYSVSNGDVIYINSLATSTSKYLVTLDSEGFSVGFLSSRAIPEPSVLGLILIAMALLSRQLKPLKQHLES